MSDEVPPFSVRHATIDDLAAIKQLTAAHVAARKLMARTDEELAKLIQHGFVAEVAGELVGFAAVEIYSLKLAELQCLAVADVWQGKGIGKQLISRCTECARENGVRELMAITASDDLFMQCGFDYSLPDQKRALFIRMR